MIHAGFAIEFLLGNHECKIELDTNSEEHINTTEINENSDIDRSYLSTQGQSIPNTTEPPPDPPDQKQSTSMTKPKSKYPEYNPERIAAILTAHNNLMIQEIRNNQPL